MVNWLRNYAQIGTTQRFDLGSTIYELDDGVDTVRYPLARHDFPDPALH